MELCEYLLKYGQMGDFGRFRPARPCRCQRGDRAVVRTHRGLELGVVLCEAQPGHARFLPNTSVGTLLRLATKDDEETARRLGRRSLQLFEEARELTARFDLPLEVLDAEILLDGRQAVLHYVRGTDCDPRPLMDALSDGHGLLVALHDLALPASDEEAADHEHVGCGEPNCGGGACGTSASSACATCGLKSMIRSVR
jgi:hypothetical protein